MNESNLKYNVIFLNNEGGGYTAAVPALPGCISEGLTLEEATSNIKEAIELYLEVLVEEKEEIPTDTNFVSGIVDVRSPITVYA